MSKWRDFEIKIFKYLRRRYSFDGQIKYFKEGHSDSNSLDIKVIGTKNGELHIEVKSPIAQAGQFVLKLNPDSSFEFLPNIKSPSPTKNQTELIKYLNKLNIDNVNQTAIKLNNYPEAAIFSLIKEHYLNKGARFFITGELDNEKDKVCIVPTEEINDAFIAEANLRRKKSGSRSLPKKSHDTIEAILKRHFKQQNITELKFNITTDRTKVFLNFENNEINLPKEVIYFSNNENNYYLSQKTKSSYEIKVLSKTNNINIVYSLKHNWIRKPEWINKFIEELQRL